MELKNFKGNPIYEALAGAGFQAYFVGGCVRDALMGIEAHDIDICTDAPPEETLALFGRSGFKTIPTGIKHGTITAIRGNVRAEVTTLRSDGEYADGRRPESVEFGRDLKTDLARRDFTINAMAYNETEGLIDPFGGRDDLSRRLVRAVGEPELRFGEDALRMLRAVRFASRLGFEIEAGTLAAITVCAPRIALISAERIREELIGILTSPRPGHIKMLYDIGLSAHFMPQLALLFDPAQNRQNTPYHLYDVGEHTLRALADSPPDEEVRLALLLHDIGKPRARIINKKGLDSFPDHEKYSEEIAREILRALKFPSRQSERIRRLVLYHGYKKIGEPSGIKRLLIRLGEVSFESFLAVARADSGAHAPPYDKKRLEFLDDALEIYRGIIARGEPYTLSGLALNGRDAASLGLEGVRIGEALRACLELVIEHPEKNTRGELAGFIAKNYLDKS